MACKMDVMLVYEVYTEERAMTLYPINVLRNLARLQVRGCCCLGLSWPSQPPDSDRAPVALRPARLCWRF